MLTTPQRNVARDCYCCSHLSRKTQDEKLAKLVLPLAPKDEWNLFWNPEELPPTTGSKQLDNFIILRLVFVYLPLDLETLLSVASACRAWRLVSDRLPHWRYLLPLRTEVLQIMSENHWFDRDYSRGTYPKFEKDFSPFDDEYVAPGEQPHYNLKVSSRMLAYIKSGATPGARTTFFGNNNNKKNNNKKRKTTKKIITNNRRRNERNDDDDETTSDDEDYQYDSGELEENNKNNKNKKSKPERPAKIPGCRICPKCCCDSSDDVCGDGCGECSSCECSSRDDVKEEVNIITEKERNFIAAKSDTHVMLEMIGNEEREFAQQCFFNHRENLDWGQLLEENEKQKENEREKRRKLVAEHRAKKHAARKLLEQQQQVEGKARGGSPQATAVQSVQIAGPNQNDPEQEMFRRYPDGQEDVVGANHNSKQQQGTKYPTGIDNNNKNDDSTDVDSIELANIPGNNNTRYPQANDYGNSSGADDEKDNNHNNNVPNATTARRRSFIASDSDSSIECASAAPLAAGAAARAGSESDDQVGQQPNPDDFAVLRQQSLPSSDPLSSIVYSLKLDQFEKYITNHVALDEAKKAKQHRSPPPTSYRNTGPTFPVRAQHSTLVTNSGKIMISKEAAGFRRNFMFPTLSSYLSYVRKLLKASKKEINVSFLERYFDLIHFFFWCCIVFAIAYASCALLGFYVDKTSILRATDQIVAREVSATVVIPVIFAFGLLISTFAESIFDREFDRPAMVSKAWGLLLLMYGLCLMSVPVSLLFARVNVADRLLAGGEVSVCDAWSSLPLASTVQSSIFKSETVVKGNWSLANSSQCKLPVNLLPEAFAQKTFLEFPPGTKILYHPPDFLRTKIVSYSASYINSTHCQVDSNTVIDFLTQDRGYNQSKSDVGRGNVGYYTVIFPSSCSSPSNGIKNTTVIILGDFESCPFWSTNDKRTSLSASTQFLHPRFTGILTPAAAASDTESTARSISKEFGDAILNVSASTFSVASQTCATRPENLLVTVSSTNSHKFYLRVSQGFIEHWSASYYIPRLPYSPADGGPYASRPYWRNTLDYQLNGVVALMADWKIFINHKNAAAPTTPHNYGDTENSNAFQDSDETGGKWSDDEMSPFWTAAHPAGIRRFRYDFFWGAIGYIIFAFCMFCIVGFWLLFSRGKKRVRLLIVAFLILICVGTQIPLLIQASICYALVAPDDSLELTNPVGCLQASEIDSQGVLIFAAVFGGIYTIAIMIVGCFACCEQAMDDCCDSCGNCCDTCCEKLCDPICDCCKPICECCEKCCKPCCDCFDYVCDCCCGKVCDAICCDSDTC